MELYPVAEIWNNDALINQDHVTFFKTALGFNPNNVKARVTIREDIQLALVEIHIDTIPLQICFFTIDQDNEFMQITKDQYQLHKHEKRKQDIQQAANSFPAHPMTFEIKTHLTQIVQQAVESNDVDQVMQVYHFITHSFYPQLQALISQHTESESRENNLEFASAAAP